MGVAVTVPMRMAVTVSVVAMCVAVPMPLRVSMTVIVPVVIMAMTMRRMIVIAMILSPPRLMCMHLRKALRMFIGAVQRRMLVALHAGRQIGIVGVGRRGHG